MQADGVRIETSITTPSRAVLGLITNWSIMNHSYHRRIFGVLLLASMLAIFPGCIGAVSQLLYVIKGHKMPPAFEGLEGKRIAVVCVSDASAYGPDPLTYSVSNALSVKLARGLKESTIVPVTKIEEWIDTHGWDERDFVELGEGVDVDAVVAIDIASYTIHDGSTLFKGRADVTATVYNIEKEGQIEHHYGPKLFEYPKTGRPAIQTTARQFEALYLGQLVTNLSNQFCEYDKLDSFAADAILNTP